MAASTVQNPPAPAESKSARKKKSKTERTDSPAPAASTPEKPASVADAHEDSSESPYIRELQKSIRNVNKKITNASRIDHLVAEHGSKTLDELITLKIINNDQKAAYLKKPSLQAQLAQYEEQLQLLKKIDQEHRARLAEQEKALTAKFEKETAELVVELKDKALVDADASLSKSLLVLSQFLRLAAARRAEEADTSLDENQALEGVLLHIYSGDDNAVATMLKLVRGSDEQTRSTSGETLKTTFAQVKEAAIAHAAPLFATEPAPQTTEQEPVVSSVESEDKVETDPTVANAGLTEVEDGSATALTNGHAQEEPSPVSPPGNTDVNDSAANEAGESQWDIGNETSTSQEWVDVKIPRDPSETETGLNATPAAPAAPANTQSWADDHPEGAPADANEGFHQVQRNRGGRGGGRGFHRGRGGGHRGDGRGRGRGGQRGAGPRGPRRGGDEQPQHHAPSQ